MGSLANESLRKKRMFAHYAFDRLWKGTAPVFTRKQAYNWLKDQLGGYVYHLNIGNMGEAMCSLVIEEARRVMRSNENKRTGS